MRLLTLRFLQLFLCWLLSLPSSWAAAQSPEEKSSTVSEKSRFISHICTDDTGMYSYHPEANDKIPSCAESNSNLCFCSTSPENSVRWSPGWSRRLALCRSFPLVLCLTSAASWAWRQFCFWEWRRLRSPSKQLSQSVLLQPGPEDRRIYLHKSSFYSPPQRPCSDFALTYMQLVISDRDHSHMAGKCVYQMERILGTILLFAYLHCSEPLFLLISSIT